jgi:APA family basic amino acid/polyamine antiporter
LAQQLLTHAHHHQAMSLFRKKPIAAILVEAQTGEGDAAPSLKRTLGAWQLTMLGIGVVIGAGLFSLTGKVAADNAGPAVVFSYMISGLACAFAGLCYAEFASSVPVAGSAYSYSYATMGELLAWIIGWDLVMEYAIGAGTVAVSWSAYFVKFCHQLHLDFPIQFALSPFDSAKLGDGTVVHGIANLPAAVIVVLMSLLLIRGTKESAWFNSVMVALKVTIVLLVIGLGWAYMNPANHSPMIPARVSEVLANGSTIYHFGWQGVLTGAGLIFFAYIGFDAVSTAAQEAKNPQRDLPIGILGSLFICTILYILFSWVITGLCHYSEFSGLDKLAPVAKALDNMPEQYHWLQQLIVPAILCGFSSVIMVLLMGQSRVFITMSQDGLLPKLFSEIHPVRHTPWKSNILFAVVVGGAVALLPGNAFGEMCSVGTLLAFVLVCIGVIVLRYTNPDLPRKFRCPWVPLVPALGALCCLTMMAFLPQDTWWRLLIWMAIGLTIYFLYSRKHSKLNGDS